MQQRSGRPAALFHGLAAWLAGAVRVTVLARCIGCYSGADQSATRAIRLHYRRGLLTAVVIVSMGTLAGIRRGEFVYVEAHGRHCTAHQLFA